MVNDWLTKKSKDECFSDNQNNKIYITSFCFAFMIIS